MGATATIAMSPRALPFGAAAATSSSPTAAAAAATTAALGGWSHRGTLRQYWLSIFIFGVFWSFSSVIFLEKRLSINQQQQQEQQQRHSSIHNNNYYYFFYALPAQFAANYKNNLVVPPSFSSFAADAVNNNNNNPLGAAGNGKNSLSNPAVALRKTTNEVLNDPNRAVRTGSSPEYAYAFVVGGCNPDKPSYRFYLYNIMVSAKILQEQGSVADVVVFVQMAWASNRTTLPEDEERWLREMNIRVHYMQPIEDETFYRTVLHKFLILGLTEYKRVILMDGDIMPTFNLDYLFQMSLAGTLKENFIYQGGMEPSNAGFFMLTPDPAALDEMDAIIHRRAENARRLPHPYFDEVEGWGHVIEPPDQWESKSQNGTRWTFWCAFADQGLLYHWTKYVRKSVSILKPNGIVDNWGPDPDSAYGVKLEKRLEHTWDGIVSPSSQCWGKSGYCNLGPPFSHFVHFTGRSKPWWNPPAHLHEMKQEDSKTSPEAIWFWHLMKLDEQFHWQLNFSTWGTGKGKESGPLLGMHSSVGQAKRVDGLDRSWQKTIQ